MHVEFSRAATVIGVTETPLSVPIADRILTSGEPATAEMPCKLTFHINVYYTTIIDCRLEHARPYR
jgi:hypothetical protein